MDPESTPRRWLILSTYCFLSISCFASWYSFSSISNIIQKLYRQNLIAVNWLALTYPIVAIVLMLPSSFLCDNYGIRIVMVTAGFFNLLGCCVKYGGYALQHHGFWFLLAGNMFCGVGTSAFIFLPSRIARLWFGAKERAKATSISIAANSLGLAIGYIQPSAMVKNSQIHEDILDSLGYYLLAITFQSFLTFLFIVAVIRDKPKTSISVPASIPLTSIGENGSPPQPVPINSSTVLSNRLSHLIEFKKLLQYRSYHAILHINGILFGTEAVWLVILNEILIKRFPGYEVEIGSMGALGLAGSIPSNFLVGVLLDRTRKFKIITIIVIGISFVLVIVFTILFNLTNSFISFFILYVMLTTIFASYYTISYDHSAEVTFPISEAKSGVLSLFTAQIYSLVLPSIAGRIISSFGSTIIMYFISAMYLLSFMISLKVADKGPRTHYFLNQEVLSHGN